jgi:hypothetical protein
MDALLLTQGWSNYKYENEAFNPDFKFLPEKGLTVSGKIKNLWFSKKKLKKTVELTAVYGPLNVATQQVDSTGCFKMNLEDYYKDKFKVALQTKNIKGKKQDYTIELEEYESPIINYKKEEKVYLPDSTNIFLEVQMKVNQQNKRTLKIADGTIALDEVLLEGYNLTPQRQKMMDLHGPPDLVIENDELINEAPKWNWGLYSALQASFPDDVEIVNSQAQAKVIGQNFTFIVIDGVPVTLLDYSFIGDLPIEEIKSFELIKNPKNAHYYVEKVFRGPYGQQEIGILGALPRPGASLDKEGLYGVGVYIDPDGEQHFIRDLKTSIISIYTYAGKGLNYVGRNKGINRLNIQGFAPKREFYAPKYGADDINDWNIPDLRSVIHWAPNVNTDENGEAKIEFYNADNTGEMLVVVEGITQKGKIGHNVINYYVQK